MLLLFENEVSDVFGVSKKLFLKLIPKNLSFSDLVTLFQGKGATILGASSLWRDDKDVFEIGDQTLKPGERRTIDLPVGFLPNHTPMTLPVHVICGKKPGPALFISAAFHGNEITGVEIIRRVLQHKTLKNLRGTLLAIPIVNALGYLSHSRYLPDGRDLNRCFPGSDRGSLASILADLFLKEILSRCTCGIDLHSAGAHRTNLPQIRIASHAPYLLELAEAFCPPVIVLSKLREGSLRAEAFKRNIPVLLYEGGEAMRLDSFSVRAGVLGIFRVLKFLGMLKVRSIRLPKIKPALSRSSFWIRAPEGGLFIPKCLGGDYVHPEEALGIVSSPFGDSKAIVTTQDGGVLIGHSKLPVVNKGDALFHIAKIPPSQDISIPWDIVEEDSELLADEDEIL